ncbi:MAG: class I SAM-dependent methyltransferase [Bradyrhizobium sp.]|jgi:ubiquinone/menaquinone biosynthesis C-methylase UbiE
MTYASSSTVEQVRPGTAPTSDLNALKIRQQAAWSSGNYAVVGTTLQIVGEQLCEALDLTPGSKVLDVAAGNGMASLAAARRWCRVTSTDYVPALLQNGRARAEAEGHQIEFMEADAEDLPFENGSFDVVLSTFGVMFTPNQDRAAAELLRVCKAKGRIGLANWTPEGFIGQVFKTLGKYLPPPPSARSPALWGTRTRLAEMFGSATSAIEAETRQFNFRYRSPKHFLNIFETYYGPIHRAFLSLDDQGQTGLRNDLHALIVRTNRATDGTMVVPSEYLEVVITKR